MIAREIIAGKDLKAGDVIYEKDGLAYASEGEVEQAKWELGFAKDDTLKGKPVTILPQLDLVGG